jgi:hypothetical protein
MSETFAAGFLSVTQSAALRAVALTRSYDLVLAALSWEQRATTALAATSNLNGKLILLKFASSSREIEAAKDQALAKFQDIFPSETLDLNFSTEFAKNASRIEAHPRFYCESRTSPQGAS